MRSRELLGARSPNNFNCLFSRSFSRTSARHILLIALMVVNKRAPSLPFLLALSKSLRKALRIFSVLMSKSVMGVSSMSFAKCFLLSSGKSCRTLPMDRSEYGKELKGATTLRLKELALWKRSNAKVLHANRASAPESFGQSGCWFNWPALEWKSTTYSCANASALPSTSCAMVFPNLSSSSEWILFFRKASVSAPNGRTGLQRTWFQRRLSRMGVSNICY